jgi:ribonucleotide monophosphatase NagD (HAD superfamily)
MIGDNVRADIEGARAAGIEAILVRTICEDLESIGDLRELPDRLDRR